MTQLEKITKAGFEAGVWYDYIVWDHKIPSGVRVVVHNKINNRHRVATLKGDTFVDYRTGAEINPNKVTSWCFPNLGSYPLN